MLRSDCLTGVGVCLSPLIRIFPLEGAVDLAGVEGVILTSAQAVPALATAINRASPMCFCVGETTANAARDAGFAARSAGGDADALVAALSEAMPKGRLLHLRGRHSRGDIAARLTRAGLEVTEQVVYDQALMPLTRDAHALLDGEAPVLAPFFSPRTAAHFAGQMGGRAPIHAIAMSAAVGQELGHLGLASLTIARRPDAQSMVTAVENGMTQLCRVERSGGAQ